MRSSVCERTPKTCVFWAVGALSGDWNSLPASADDRQALGTEDLARLTLGVAGPGADRIEPDVAQPVLQGAPPLSLPFVGERQIIVCVGIAGHERDRTLVGFDRFRQAFHLIQHVAQVEEGQ